MKQNNEALWKQRAFYVVKKETIMELMVPIENKDSIPLYEQIYRYIKTEIRAGRLRAGSRLPSTRTLADNLHVSRSTTQLAYEQLLSEGYISL